MCREAELDERELVERTRSGDAGAYDALVKAFYPGVYATAFHLSGNHEDAEDLAQECFVRAHQGLSWYRGDGGMRPWLRRIVVHLARDRFRSRARRPASEPLLAAAERPGDPGPSDELRRREASRLIAEALQRLPTALRIPLVLRTLEGLEYDEVARATGVTPATARTQVMKARRALLRLLDPLFRFEHGGER
jgi:RNA polymerase sigma-70 factor (ECF subfamily)